ncbi:MAG: hypothetical protein ABS06_06145 [Methylophilales bacterium BACL14 MAG-120910-bin43]|jgi:xanthine permease XanP|nr:MAG: hypothetical protein ABS06_06145 [Methylophilales bacterium BACL14 MAG-120910-bin43]KRP06766.1 MAG: hypothetical protein ABS29_02715 [Methylophilales bacterium BACL14 MAG-120920-bin58]
MSDNNIVRFEPDEKPAHLLSAGLGLQVTIMIVTGIMLTPLIVGREAGLGAGQISWLVFAAVLACGVSTWLQASRFGIIGGRNLLFVGSNVAFISVAVSALELGGTSLLLTLVAVASLATFIFTSQMGPLRKVLTPAIGGVVLMLMALNVAPVVWSMLKRVPAEFVGNMAVPYIFLATLIPILLISLFGSKTSRLWAPLIGIVIGSIYSYQVGLVDFSKVITADWIGLPDNHWPGFDFTFNESFWALLPAFVLITFVGCIETYADGIAVQKFSYRKARPIDFRAIQGAINADGVGSFLAGILGSVPNTVYSMSIGVMEITKVAALRVGFYGGLFMILFALSPKLIALISAIPSPVAAGYILVIIILLFGHGLQMVNQTKLSFEALLAVCFGFFAGVGFQGGFLFNEAFPEGMQIFLSNGTTSGGLTAILIMFLFSLKKRAKNKLSVPLHITSIEKINHLINNFAKTNQWQKKWENKLMLIAEEGLNFLIENQEKNNRKNKVTVHIRIYQEGDEVELEFISAPSGVNAESAAAAIKDIGEDNIESKLSLKLLYGLTNDIKHLQYHGIDYLFLKVNPKLN